MSGNFCGVERIEAENRSQQVCVQEPDDGLLLRNTACCYYDDLGWKLAANRALCECYSAIACCEKSAACLMFLSFENCVQISPREHNFLRMTLNEQVSRLDQ